MSGNPLPWIVLAAVVAATLYLKGYAKLPSFRPPGYMTPPVGASTPARVHTLGEAPADIDALVKLGSYVLGIAFAKAVRIEAEATLAGQIARDAGEAIHKQFTAPFSPPAPAGQSPLQAGDQRPL